MIRSVLLFAALLCAAPADASWRDRRRPTSQYQEYTASVQTPTTYSAASAYSYRTTLAVDALDEVNALRATRGLPAFVRDDGLTVAAMRAAEFRAANLMFGHLTGGMGDYAFLPSGVQADATGCSAHPPHYGFLACEQYGSYRFAGAATVIGVDGRAFHHLYLRR